MRTDPLGLCAAVALLSMVPSLAGAQGAAKASDAPDPTAGSRWGANYFPNVELITHDGKRVRFFDDLIEDKVVAINFIYTTCPDVCPLETARLSELQAILGDRVGRDVFMYSITIDPEVDTPEVLAEYRKGFQAGPGWLFLTGDERDIELLRRKLSLYREEIQNDSNDHNLSLIIGNQRTGRWMKRSPFDNPYYLANQLGGWLTNWKTAPPQHTSYADAPRLRQTGLGESLFRTRCSACHVIGGRDRVPPHQSGRLLGPDLMGVTKRRDPAWLARWLQEPDRMLAENDPIAVELFEKHGKVVMPNFSLNQRGVEALIEYLEQEGRRAELVEHALESAPEVVERTGAAPSCCQKDAAPVLADAPERDAEPRAGGYQAPATVRRRQAPAPASAATGLTRASVLAPFGLGWVFLFLAVAARRGT